MFRLAEYLEQHGRTTRPHLCPPGSFWHAAHTRLTHPDDLHNLAQAAEDRHRLQWAHHLRHRAADHGSTHALEHLARLRDGAGDRVGAESLYREAADHGSTDAMNRLARLREEAGDQEGAGVLAREAADRGNTDALIDLAREAADRGDVDTLVALARMRAGARDQEGAEAMYREAADRGCVYIPSFGMEDTIERLWPFGLDPGGTPTLPWQRGAAGG
ncbi:hypothetical protein [Streptomyces sp. C10-9-1]|uniref:hypothetical protein n=1 Tax=Streptomyces sp. C10-9-1 TaxID=1859285 RepID=UPI003F4A2779